MPFKATLDETKFISLSLQDNVEIPYNWIDYIYHVGSSHDCNSTITKGLLGEGEDSKEGWQTVFFTAVDPMNESQEDEPYAERSDQNAVYWITT